MSAIESQNKGEWKNFAYEAVAGRGRRRPSEVCALLGADALTLADPQGTAPSGPLHLAAFFLPRLRKKEPTRESALALATDNNSRPGAQTSQRALFYFCKADRNWSMVMPALAIRLRRVPRATVG